MKRDLPYFDVCISNTPYQISSPLTFKLISHRPLFRCAILMFQRKFALRTMTQVKQSRSDCFTLTCRLSVNCQLYSKVTHVMKARKRTTFKPPPMVESSVVKIEPLNPPPPVNFEEWDGLIRIVFALCKTRSLQANFKTKEVVLDMLENNYKTFCAENENGKK